MKLIIEIRTLLLQLRLSFFKSKQDLVIVTGSDSSHFKSLYQLLKSLEIQEKNTKIIVYDLGMTIEENKTIKDDFSSFELRNFDYNKYPNYFNTKKNAGEYAWKPVIVNTILNEFKTSVCWLDGGNKVLTRLTLLRKIIEFYGFYSPFSKGIISDWTHIKTLEYLNISNDKNILKKRNLNGACVAANYNNLEVRAVIQKWSDCAKIKKCIAPEGSSRENHRQDQAVLSALVYKHIPQIGKKMIYRKFGFKTHQDID